MSSDVEIRDGEPDDAEAVSGLLKATWHHTYDAIIGADAVAEITARWHAPDKLRTDMALPDGRFLLAFVKGTLAGHGFARPHCDGAVEVNRLYVLPQMQGRALGARLLQTLLDDFPGHSFRLEVQQDNAGAIAFYKRHGFAVTGESAHCGSDSDVPSFFMERPGV